MNKFIRRSSFLLLSACFSAVYLYADPAVTWLSNLDESRSAFHVVGGLDRGQAISSDGSTVVGSVTRPQNTLANLEKEAFLAHNGVMLGLGLPSPFYFDVLDIQICGNSDTIYGVLMGGVNHPFRWTWEEGYKILDRKVTVCSADGRIVAGQELSSKQSSFYQDHDGELISIDDWIPANFARSVVSGMSADGQVVVGNLLDENDQLISSFVWTVGHEAAVVDINPPQLTEIGGISADGATIFGSIRAPYPDEVIGFGFLWRDGHNLQALRSNQDGLRFVPKYSSFDGKTVVGDRLEAQGFRVLSEPFIWQADQGLQSFSNFLKDKKNVNPSRGKLDGIRGIAADAQSFAGSLVDYGAYDELEGWILNLAAELIDLELQTSPIPSLSPGQLLNHKLNIRNSSSRTASGVRLVVSHDPIVDSAIETQENLSCLQVAIGLRCEIGNLAPGESLSLELQVRAISPGSGRLQLALSSDQFETSAKNNNHLQNFVVKGQDSQLFIRIPGPQFKEGELVKLHGYALSHSGIDYSDQIRWTVGRLGTNQIWNAEGVEFSAYLPADSYLVVAEFVDESGLTIFSRRLGIDVERVPHISASYRIEETGFLFWKRKSVVLSWQGALGPVAIFQEKSCQGNSWMDPSNCMPYRHIESGAASGVSKFDYQKYDRYLVCEEGTDPGQAGFETLCSAVVQVLD